MKGDIRAFFADLHGLGPARGLGRQDRDATKRLGKRSCQGRVVGVGVGDQDVADSLAVEGRDQSLQVRGQHRAGVNDGNGAAPDDVGPRAGEGEGAGVRRHDPSDERRYRVAAPIGEVEISNEGDHG